MSESESVDIDTRGCSRLVHLVQTSVYNNAHYVCYAIGPLTLPTYASLPTRELPAFNLQVCTRNIPVASLSNIHTFLYYRLLLHTA